MILAIVRFGAQIAIPGIDVVSIKLEQELASTGTLYNIIAGGYNSNWSIVAMGIGPYITSSIIMQLLTVAIPKIEQLSKEGEEGRKKISKYSRYLTVVLATIQAIGLTYRFASQSMFLTTNQFIYIAAVISLVAGTTLIMWLAEQITAKGISNGSSMIIFVNIISNLPAGLTTLIGYTQIDGILDTVGLGKVSAIVLLLLAVLVFIVVVNNGERKIPVQYSSKVAGNRSYGGKSTFIPIKVNTGGVISIIFAISLLQFPETISQFLPVSTSGTLGVVIEALKMTNPSGAALYVILIILFSYFYTSIVINPIEMAENMKKNGGFIPGIRPGQPTSSYITRVVGRITFVGAIVFATIAFVPILLQWIFGFEVGFGGTTLVIVVGVCLDVVKSLESQLLMRHYKGFLND